MELEGRTYLITGGTSGLGEACVAKLLHYKANVVSLDIGEQEGDSKDSARFLFVKTDVTNEESVKNAIDQALKKFGKIHGAVNCAGVGAAKRTASKSGPHDFGLFKTVLDINLNGTFNVCRLAAAAMASQKPDANGERGVIINTASVAAFEGQIGQVAYAASKGAIVSMTIVMARDLASLGIRVNTIAPGIFDTPMMKKTTDEVRAHLAKTVQFPQRFGTPAEFADLVVFMIRNRYLNGETIRLDGALRMAAM
eukprot:TRINITY_DN8862_c0_g1_i1.p1 TRINITY_DN8862_c0_g1~~TRINITY_DN8862_c0_g1_i1.p1  ORF type:complete len:253 (+),score=25.47 TRINITY_DN8862_c0_g1_i1:34-792(+)